MFHSTLMKILLGVITAIALISLSSNPAQLVAALLLLTPVVVGCLAILKTLRFIKPFVKNMLLRILPEPPVPHYPLKTHVPAPRREAKSVSKAQSLMDIPAYARKQMNISYPMTLDNLRGKEASVTRNQSSF